MNGRIHVGAMLLLGTLALGACGGKPEPAPPSPVAQNDDEAARLRAEREAAERARMEAEERARREAEQRAATLRATLQEMVFFDYDQAAVRSDAKARLDAKLAILRNDPSIRLRIAGHADERGSTEYNVALGSRRAGSVKEYFMGYGLSADRFETISYGEERPLDGGHAETSWSRNRRAEFQVIGGTLAQNR